MDYRQLGGSGVRVSRICLGTMMFGGPTSETDSLKIIDRAFDEGVNFLDTANIYCKGESERVVGKAIAQRRDDWVLATKATAKMGDGPNQRGSSRFHLLNELEASLKRLGTDHVDLWYLHQPDPLTPQEESLRAVDDAVRQGKVRYAGCSNYWAWQITEGLGISDKRGYVPFTCTQPLYNIVNRDIEKELLPACARHGVGVVSYSPLARGVLTGKYKPNEPLPEGSRGSRNDPRMMQTELRQESFAVAQNLLPIAEGHGRPLSQFAVAWVLANSLITSVIVGPRTMEQFQDNLAGLDLRLSEADEDAVDSLVAPGEHTTRGYQDPAYPITGRPRADAGDHCEVIYHLARRSDWEASLKDGRYAPDGLKTEGFLHATRERYKLLEVANQFFAGEAESDLLMVTLDCSRLESPVKYEDPGVGHLFPHVYGPVNFASILSVEPMIRDSSGWRFPAKA